MDITSVKPPEQRRRRRRGGFFLRFLGFMFAAGMIVFIAVAGAAAFVLWKVSSELPDYEVLAKYEPPVMTRIHANDGALIAELSNRGKVQLSPQTNTTFAGFFGWSITFVPNSQGVTTHLLEMHISGNYRYSKTK